MDAQHYRELLKENLRLHRPELLAELRAQGELEAYLRETSEHAASRFSLLVSQLLKANPPPKDYLARVSHIAQIDQVADELVREDLIQLPDSDTEKASRQGGYRDELRNHYESSGRR